MTGNLWRICCFFCLHLSLAVAVEPYEVADWYHNLNENLMQPNESVAAQFAAEVYLRLQKWENMSMSLTPALVDELQALIARINGVRESNEVMVGQLEGEEHPQVPILLSLRTDLRATCDDPRIPDSIIVALREVRRGCTMEEASDYKHAQARSSSIYYKQKVWSRRVEPPLPLYRRTSIRRKADTLTPRGAYPMQMSMPAEEYNGSRRVLESDTHTGKFNNCTNVTPNAQESPPMLKSAEVDFPPGPGAS
ncbi:hypothetical protein PENSPDRAFT_671716 [Peniophora sp. CONT]|nr:hypothetical protein PENSPDRAFT_671716 [Peniophora sp. CONT]